MHDESRATSTRVVGTLDGKELVLRPVRASDRALLVAGFDALGPDSRYRRFFTPKSALSNEELRALTESDGEQAFVLGLAARDAQGHESPVGVARYQRLSDPEAAEAAVTIVDAVQGRGLGKLLWRELAIEARRHGVRRFRCMVLTDNPAIHKLLHAIDLHPRLIARDAGAEEYEVILPEIEGSEDGDAWSGARDPLRFAARPRAGTAPA